MKPKSFINFVKEMGRLIKRIKEKPWKIEPAIKECGQWIRKMYAALNMSKTDKEKHHIASCICKIHAFRCQMKMMRGVVSTGYKPSHPNRLNYLSARVKWDDTQSAFLSKIRTSVINNLKHKDPSAFLDDACVLFERHITDALKKVFALKVSTVFYGEFTIPKLNEEEVREIKNIIVTSVAIYNNTNLWHWFQTNVKESILNQLQEFQERDSGWTLSRTINLNININIFTPQLGSSYIKLPEMIHLKKACINVQNNDRGCFGWAVVSALYPVPHGYKPHLTSSYPHYSTVLNLKNISMPMSIKQIPRFEAQNNVSVNVYILKQKKKKFSVHPTYLTKDKKARHVNLLLIQNKYVDEDEEEEEVDVANYRPRYHYVWIKSLSRLLSAQLSKHDGRKYICDRCLHYFYTQEKLDQHEQNCVNMNECRVKLPPPNTTVYFKNHHYKEMAPFIVYADLECLLTPSDKKLQNHVPYSIGYYVKCSYDDSLSFYKSHRGEDCQHWFALELKQLAEDVETVFLCPLPMDPLTLQQQLEFLFALKCSICEKRFKPEDVKVKDHCHLTGKYRGPAHNQCNLNYKDSHVIPVVFHNLSGYDAHFIIKNLAKDFDGRIDLLPINKERYISFTKHIRQNFVKFRFIDSYRFLTSSLDKLASYLESYPILKSQFNNLNDVQFRLLTRKGVFCYDYINSWTKLDETVLPERLKFYNILTDSNVSDEDYAHANMVYKLFQCQNLGEYADIYLKTDILLLADVFEQFRHSCLSTYGLDPAHYYTLPGYTWDAMLKFTHIHLELLSDIDMVMYIERGVRGGLSQCSKRHARANNKYMHNYNSEALAKYLIYLDINNQYGWAMSQYLPYGGFEWVNDVENFNYNVPENHPEGYILEVDLEYPQNIHDSHADIPFCSEHLSAPGSKGVKLSATVFNKERYIIHYRNLIQAVNNGLVIKKVHRVLKFKQSPWLKAYIDLNTKQRMTSKNDFEKNLFKLMNNAVFGKTMENVRKHSIVKLVTNWPGRYGAEALISKPNFKSSAIFDENLVAVELNKTEVYFNKPIYVGMCILDVSKLKIYDFHYEYIKSRFQNKAQICYTDTDSLIYEIETDDLYQVIKEDAFEYFDTSDYPYNNIYNIPRVNKKVLGMMKDENNGRIMTEFVGLRSKMYSTRVEKEDGYKKAKGVKKHIIKNRITFQDYLACVNEGKETRIEQMLIQSKNHNVSTVAQTKIALSPNDDKRYICEDGISTLPWGHFSIKNESS